MAIKISNQRFWFLIFPLAFSVGCSVPTKKGMDNVDVPARATIDTVDSALLSQFSAASSGEKITAAGVTYTLGGLYQAASGHRCRAIVASATARPQRVVCEKGDTWFFAEDVFGERM